jgi:hypothetical protein
VDISREFFFVGSALFGKFVFKVCVKEEENLKNCQNNLD